MISYLVDFESEDDAKAFLKMLESMIDTGELEDPFNVKRISGKTRRTIAIGESGS